MISLKVLSAAAAIALVAPMIVSTQSFAQGGGALTASRMGYHAGGVNTPVPSARQFSAGVPPRQFGGAGVATRQFGGGNYAYQGRRYGGGYPYHRHHRYVPPVVIGGAFASSYGYYDSPAYYDAPAYGESYYDDSAVVATEVGPETIAECKRRFRSYDVRSQTYLGYDGLRHSCP